MKATIRYTTDKNGKVIIHRWSKQAVRWIRISKDDAEMMLATGNAVKA